MFLHLLHWTTIANQTETNRDGGLKRTNYGISGRNQGKMFSQATISKYGGHRPAIIIIPTSKGSIHLRAGTILPKRKANPHTTAHWVLLLSNLVDVLLFLFDLGVLGHVFDGGEVIIVTCVDLGVKGGNERCTNGAEIFPFDAIKEGMIGHLSQG